MNIKDIDFAIEMLSHPQRGDESDINEALVIALKSLKAQREVLEQKLIIDKVRDWDSVYANKNNALNIIEKYKEESEGKE